MVAEFDAVRPEYPGQSGDGTLANNAHIQAGNGTLYHCAGSKTASLYVSSGNLSNCVMASPQAAPTSSGAFMSCQAGKRLSLSSAGYYQSCT